MNTLAKDLAMYKLIQIVTTERLKNGSSQRYAIHVMCIALLARLHVPSYCITNRFLPVAFDT